MKKQLTPYKCPVEGCEAGALVPAKNGFPLRPPGYCIRHGEEFQPEAWLRENGEWTDYPGAESARWGGEQ